MELKGKVVVITGGSKGLGKELAALLVKEGCTVVISSRTKTELKQTAQELGVFPVVADVTKEKQVQKLAARTVKKFGRIDIWINNAGTWMKPAPIEELDLKLVQEILKVNLFGVIHGSRAALVQMKKQQSGTIINILSTAALESKNNEAGYVASKFAARGFTEVLQLEAAPYGIKVLSVFPGGMQTDFFNEQRPDYYDKFQDPQTVATAIVENLKLNTPQERLVIRRGKVEVRLG